MIFVDTWAWLALASRRDPYHNDAVEQHGQFHREKRRYLTTDFVLNEVITALFSRTPFEEARRFVDGLIGIFDSGRYELHFVSPRQFREAYHLRLKFQDKPDISFVDLTSMVVMQDRGIEEVFTGDAHFRQVGMGFRLFP